MNTKAFLALLASLAGVAVVGATNACLPCADHDETQHFTPAQDDDAVDRMQKSWTGRLSDGRVVTVDLCEDVGNTIPPLASCDWTAVHLVRGGGQGKDESYTESSSCTTGGCTHQAAMNAVAELVVDGESTPLHGAVSGDYMDFYTTQKGWIANLKGETSATSIEIDYDDTYGIYGYFKIASVDTPDGGTGGPLLDETVQLQAIGSATCPLPTR